MRHISIDIETYSDVDIKKVGHFRYIDSPAFEVLLVAYSEIGADDVTVISLCEGEQLPQEFLSDLYDPNVVKHAFNASFEWYALSKLNKERHIIFELDGRVNYVIPETVGSCTSMTDKNDKMIFEGDIIKNFDGNEIGVVRWYSEYAAFMVRRISDNQLFWLYYNDFSNIEVIGNIHDNPELFGGAE